MKIREISTTSIHNYLISKILSPNFYELIHPKKINLFGNIVNKINKRAQKTSV